MKLTKYFLITTLFIAGAVTEGCGSSSNNNGTPAVAYTMSNGYCYQGSTVVATSNCVNAGVTTTSGIGGGYYVQNGACYTSAGVQVPVSACANGGAGNPGYYPPSPLPPGGYPYYPYPPYPYYGSGGGIFVNLH